MDWFGLFLGYIPLWAWVVISILIAAPILFYAGPVLLPIWRLLPSPLRALILGIIAALLAWAGGRYAGAKRERDAQKDREANAVSNRAKVDHEVGNLSAKDTADRLARWNRRDE